MAGADILISTIAETLNSIGFLSTGKLTLFRTDGQVVADNDWDISTSESAFFYTDLINPPVSSDLWGKISSVAAGSQKKIEYDTALNEFNKAMEAYDKVLKIRTLQPDALWLKALVLMEYSKFDDSIHLLKLAIRKRPKDALIINDLGISYEKAGKLELAYKAFKDSIAIDNNLPQANINIARYQLRNNKYIDALKKIDSAIESSPKIAEAHNIKGIILEKIDSPEKALSSFSDALSFEPNNPDILINKVRVLCDLRFFEEALENLLHAQKYIKDNKRQWNNLLLMHGLIFHKKGEYILAKEKYDKVLNEEPLHFEALVNKADINLILGNINQSYQGYYSALKIKESSPDVIYNLSRLLLLEGKFTEGWEKFESRWKTSQFKNQFKGRSIKRWDGVKSDGLYLFTWGEQGLGDQVLFLSLLKKLLSMKIYFS
mgnify:CR=1 FL=1